MIDLLVFASYVVIAAFIYALCTVRVFAEEKDRDIAVVTSLLSALLWPLLPIALLGFGSYRAFVFVLTPRPPKPKATATPPEYEQIGYREVKIVEKR